MADEHRNVAAVSPAIAWNHSLALFLGTFAAWLGILGGQVIWYSFTADEAAEVVYPGMGFAAGALLLLFAAQAVWRRKWFQAASATLLSLAAIVYGMPDR